jgi:urease accessory protein
MPITAMTTTGIRMADEVGGASLLRLLAWLSPSFPVGAFSYSHGLERAVAEGLIADPPGLSDWLRQLLEFGSGWNDAVLLAESWRRARDGGDIGEIAELGAALAGTGERHAEAMLQGAAFLKAAASWPHGVFGRVPTDCPYCVAVGAVSGAHGLPLDAALAAFLQAFAGNLVQAAIRLSVLGQTDAVATLAALEPVILATAARAAKSSLDDLGSATLLSEVMAMRHETQHSRLFRS